MALLVQDTPAEVRFQVSGKVAGSLVSELRRVWSKYQSLVFWQRVVVDLSDASECDASGEHLLARMLQNGAQFSARTPSSLDLLRLVSDRAASMERAGHRRTAVVQAGVRAGAA
jgi:hypothetical protein